MYKPVGVSAGCGVGAIGSPLGASLQRITQTEAY
jgi:hypothetical protein